MITEPYFAFDFMDGSIFYIGSFEDMDGAEEEADILGKEIAWFFCKEDVLTLQTSAMKHLFSVTVKGEEVPKNKDHFYSLSMDDQTIDYLGIHGSPSEADEDADSKGITTRWLFCHQEMQDVVNQIDSSIKKYESEKEN